MRIVIATPLYPPEIGGPATYVALLEEGLPTKGIEVEVVKFSDVRHLPKLIRHYAYYRRVLTAARNADMVFALDPVSVGLPALKAAQKAGKPCIVKIVGDYAWEQGQQRFGVTQNLDDFVKTHQTSFMVRILQKIQTQVATTASRVIVPSEYLKRVVSAWGTSSDNIKVIYNSVELPKDIPEYRKEDGIFIVSAGRRVPWKGFEAIERVAEKHGDWRVSIASGLPRLEVLARIKAADVFVLNSSYEGLSHVLIEALSLGVPIVATRVGGNPEVVTDGEDGLLIPSGDDTALENAIARIVSDAELRTRLSARARESAKRFSLETMLSATAVTLQNL